MKMYWYESTNEELASSLNRKKLRLQRIDKMKASLEKRITAVEKEIDDRKLLVIAITNAKDNSDANAVKSEVGKTPWNPKLNPAEISLIERSNDLAAVDKAVVNIRLLRGI